MNLKKNESGLYEVFFDPKKGGGEVSKKIQSQALMEIRDEKAYLMTFYLWTRRCIPSNHDFRIKAKEKEDHNNLGIYKKNGHYDVKKIDVMARVIAPFVLEVPSYVMLEAYLKGDIDEKMLKHLELGKNAIPEDSIAEKFRKVLTPSHWDNYTDAKMRSAHYNKAFKWLRSGNAKDPDYKNQLFVMADLVQLGLLNAKEKWDESRIELVAGYIMKHIDKKPSYYRLWQWLKKQK